jgi:hypothetical protein
MAERNGIRRNSRFVRKCERHGFPDDGAGLIVLARKLRNRQLTVFLPDGCLGPRTAQGRARRKQQLQIFIGVGFVDDVLCGREQSRQCHERRYAFGLLLREEGAAFCVGKA